MSAENKPKVGTFTKALLDAIDNAGSIVANHDASPSGEDYTSCPSTGSTLDNLKAAVETIVAEKAKVDEFGPGRTKAEKATAAKEKGEREADKNRDRKKHVF